MTKSAQKKSAIFIRENTLTNNKIEDEGLWRTIINGYPYKTPSQLGVANADDAYVATKLATNG